jgi:hypothetical protein
MTIASFGVASVSFLFLAGCNRGQNIRARVLDSPVDEVHRTLAIEAVNNLRALFNNGGCLAIYTRAAQSFRSQPQEDWLSQCEQLRESLGPWQSFNAQSTIRCGAPEPIVCVDGSSVFARGGRRMEVAWQLNGGQAQLLWLDLLDGNHRVLIPPLPSRQYLDSPPRNHKSVRPSRSQSGSPVAFTAEHTARPQIKTPVACVHGRHQVVPNNTKRGARRPVVCI